MIIVDTREQKPLWYPDEPDILQLKLDEGDYTTSDLINKVHAERKSGNDLYGSIIQGHARFRNELIRARDKGIKLAVFVECSKEDFIAKKFRGGYMLNAKPVQLRNMLTTIADRYDVDFIWCDGRKDMRIKIIEWFDTQRSRLNA